MYLEVITSEAISDERKHNAGSIVLTFDELFISAAAIMVALGPGQTVMLSFKYESLRDKWK
jgi:hypothetical protein